MATASTGSSPEIGELSPDSAARANEAAATINVFAHLAFDKDARRWAEAFRAGTLVGRNGPTPYGYGRAESMGCRVVFSRSAPESSIVRLCRLAVRAVVGFDLWHAWRQRREMLAADVVWTHTESQFLAAAAVLFRRSGPKLLGQAVWLFDTWPSLWRPHRLLFRRLIRRVDVLTVHSAENLAAARRLFPDKHLLLVRYGIPAEHPTPPRVRSSRPIRVIAPGSDRHRDWRTLIEALRAMPDVEATILSGTAKPTLVKGIPNVRIAKASSNAEMEDALAGATLVCVPLLPNQHASGITVIQEAVLAGIPVIATDTGGLSGYFSPSEITFVPVGNAAAWRYAIRAVADEPEKARDCARRAQAAMQDGELGAEHFVRRHVELSRTILGRSDTIASARAAVISRGSPQSRAPGTP